MFYGRGKTIRRMRDTSAVQECMASLLRNNASSVDSIPSSGNSVNQWLDIALQSHVEVKCMLVFYSSNFSEHYIFLVKVGD